MKKTFLGFGTLVAIAAPTVAVVSCGIDKSEELALEEDVAAVEQDTLENFNLWKVSYYTNLGATDSLVISRQEVDEVLLIGTLKEKIIAVAKNLMKHFPVYVANGGICEYRIYLIEGMEQNV